MSTCPLLFQWGSSGATCLPARCYSSAVAVERHVYMPVVKQQAGRHVAPLLPHWNNSGQVDMSLHSVRRGHMLHVLSVLAVDDRHVAFCEYNGSMARIICVAVATLANEKLLERASDNDLLLFILIYSLYRMVEFLLLRSFIMYSQIFTITYGRVFVIEVFYHVFTDIHYNVW
jgi:hypothetical protein